MSSRPEFKQLAKTLRQQGLPRHAANRMAEEWLAHYDDVLLSCCEAGLDASSAQAATSLQMGDVPTLARAVTHYLPGTRLVLAGRHAMVGVMRWGGAGIVGFATTMVLFVAMQHAIAI